MAAHVNSSTGSRSLRPAALWAVLALAALGALPMGAQTEPGPLLRRGPGRFSGGSSDTILVYGPTVFYHYGSSSLWNFYDDSFTADSVAGWRYLVEIANGSMSSARVSVGSQEFVGSSDLGGGSPLLRIVDVTHGDMSLGIGVKGPNNSWMSIRVVCVKDSTFLVFPPNPPNTYTFGAPPDTESATFVLPAGADGAYSMRVINGSGTGANRVTNATLSINGSQVLSASDFGSGIATITKTVSLADTNSFSIINQSATGTKLTVSFRATDHTAPVVTEILPTGTPDTVLTDSNTVTFKVGVADETPGLLSIYGGTPQATPGTVLKSVSLPNNQVYSIGMYAVNSATLATSLLRRVVRDTIAPAITLQRPASDMTVTSAADTFAIVGQITDLTTTTFTIDGDTVFIGSGSSIGFTHPYHLDVGQNGILFSATDALGHKTEFRRWVRRVLASETPPDSDVAASEATSTGIRPFKESVAFLFSGGSPIQTDAVTDSIKVRTASVVRGRIFERDGDPLANAVVSVLNHPEFGHTQSRENGWYDLAVNGGSRITLRFTKAGYLESQRSVMPFRNDYTVLEDVALVGKTARVSYVDLSAGQFVRSRFASDSNGARDMRVLFKPSTVAKVVKSPGDSATFSGNIRVRVTEFTIGDDGPAAMPAALPPGSAYSYCVDYTLDEADSIAAALGLPSVEVRFSKPVIGYVRNFLHLAVGQAMPNGFYDANTGLWKPDTDAVVMKVVSFSATGDTARVALVGIAGHDSVATQAELNAYQIDGYELTHLRSQFAAGDTLMRVLMRHFSTGDLNPREGPAQTLLKIARGMILRLLSLFGCVTPQKGSIIECETCVLGEQVPITGSPFTLNYRSYRSRGDKAIRTLRIPTIGDSVPDNVDRVVTYMDVAGKRYSAANDHPAAHDSVVFVWDGKDAYNRQVEGSATAHVSIGYQYIPKLTMGSGEESFDNAVAASTYEWDGLTDRRVPLTSWVHETVSLGAPSTATDGLGGWTISRHHFCDLTGQGALYRGDGTIILGEEQHAVIQSVAGCLSGISCAESLCAIATTRTLEPNDVAVAPDGTIYISDHHTHSIYKLEPGSPTLCRIAGTGSAGKYVDNVAATSSPLRNPASLALGPEGTLYFGMDVEASAGFNSDSCARVCKITPDGQVHVVAGSGATGYHGTGDGGPAVLALLARPKSIALGPDGSVFIGDSGDRDYRVRRVSPNGIITLYAGMPYPGVPSAGTSDSTGRATTIMLGAVDAVTVDADGNLYIAETGGHRIRQVTRSGLMSTLVNGSTADFWPVDLEFGPDGVLYISSNGGHMGVYRRHPDGTIALAAGRTEGGSGNLGGYATATDLTGFGPRGLGLGSDGTIYLALTHQVVVIKKPFPTNPTASFTVVSDDGSELYAFDTLGRHLWTRDALTGAVRYLFNYDAFGRLTAIYDANGDSTRIIRDGSGLPESIIAPNGQTTELGLDGAYLHTITNPAEEVVTLGTDDDGLLTSFTDAKSQEHQFEYNASDGRLHVDSDPANGSQTLVSSTGYNKHHVVRTSELGRTTSYDIVAGYDTSLTRTTTGPDGLATTWSSGADGVSKLLLPTGVTIRDSLGLNAIPAFGMLAPRLAERSITMPSGLTRREVVTETAEASYGGPLPTGNWSRQTKVNLRPPLTTTLTTTQGPATRKLVTITPVGRRDSVVVDSAGRPLSISIPGLATLTLSYDARGRATSIVQDGRGWTFDYDPKGRLLSARDTLGRTTKFRYDDADRETLRTLPDGAEVHFGYDENGNVTRITPSGQPAHTFDYSGVDQTTQYVPPALSDVAAPATTYTYNDDHQLTRVVRPDGTVVSLGYNAAKERLDSLTIARGRVIAYYQTTGQLDSLTSPDTVTVKYGYDGALMTSETWTGRLPGISSLAVSRTFTPQFEESTQTVGSTSPVVFSHDSDGLLTGAGGLLIQRNGLNGLVESTQIGDVTSSIEYDSHGAPANLEYAYDGSPLFEQSIQRDSLGRAVAIAEYAFGTSRTFGYRYDLAGRLYGVTVDGDTTARFLYDSNGNRLGFSNPQTGDTATATYDGQDRLLRYKDTAYKYTAAGELLTATLGSDTTLYSYDPLGSLTQAILSAGDTITYSADGTGRRVGRRVDGQWTNGWVYQSGLYVVGELDETGAVLNRYVYGERSHVPALLVRGGSTYRLITDQLGSVRGVVDVATGTVVQRRDYDAWGTATTDSNPAFQALGYAGGITDELSGLIRFGARDYEPVSGRWTSRDPMPYTSSIHGQYVYSNNSPLRYVDPTGLAPCEDLILALAYLGLELKHAKDRAYADAEHHLDIKEAYQHSRATQLITQQFGPVIGWSAAVGYEVINPPTLHPTVGETLEGLADVLVDLENDLEALGGASPEELLKGHRLHRDLLHRY